MKRIIAGVLSVAGMGVLMAANPIIAPNSVTMLQDSSSRAVTIRYTLQDAPGIVTLDVVTNGVSIGPAALRGLLGDVNRVVSPGEHAIVWLPQKVWKNLEVKKHAARAVVTAWHTSQPPDYMVVDLDPNMPGPTRYYTHEASLDTPVTNDIYKTRYLVMRKCPAAGTVWRMGAVPGQTGYREDQAAHMVSFSHDFYVGIYPCTQAQYENVMGVNPSAYQGTGREPYLTRPVENVSYEMVRGATEGAGWPASAGVDDGSFVKTLRTKTGFAFDLPTEAQWEFACRAGTEESCNLGVPMTGDVIQLCGWSWWDGQSDSLNNQTHPVGLRLPNAWGIYDMHGNVWEWCRDWYGAYEIPADNSPVLDPRGTQTGVNRIIRVGGFGNNHDVQTCAFRNYSAADGKDVNIGFRLALTVGAE